MLKSEGYKMFRGTMRIVPLTSRPPFEIKAEWLYKPECDCWYGNGFSFPAEVCQIVEDETK